MRQPSRPGSGGTAGGPGKPGPIFTRPGFPTNVDANYGILGIEGAPAAPSPWSQGIFAAKTVKRRSTRKVFRENPDVLLSAAVVVSSSRTLVEQFKTRTMRGRKLAKPGWISAMVPTGQTAVVQPSAYNRPVTLRRRATRRRLLDVPDFLSNYIAPTVAAIEMDQKPFKVKYERKIRLTPILSLYPPPTGPPSTPWLAIKAKRVSQDRRLKSGAPQIVYPATLVQPRQVDPPEITRRRDTKRKLKTVAVVSVYPYVAAAPASYLVPAKARRRKSQNRGFVWSATTLGVPATPVSVAPFDSVVPAKARRRKSQNKGFVWSATTLGVPVTGTSTAPISAAEAPDAIRRSETARKLRKVAVVPVYPATSAGATTYADQTRSLKRRATERAFRKPTVVPVYPATSAGPAVPFGAITTKRIKGRKSRGLGFVSVDAIVGQPAAGTTPALYPSVEDYGYRRRRETKRKLRTAVVAPVFPFSAPSASPDRAVTEPFKTRVGKGRKAQKLAFVPVFPATTPTPANFAALTQPKVIDRRVTERTLRRAVVAPVFPVTPAAPVVFGAIVRPKLHRRKSVSPGFVLDYALVGAPQVPTFEATEAYGYLRRRETSKVLRKPPIVPVYPATPAPAVTFDAIIPDATLRRRDTAKRLLQAVWSNVFPQTPATPAQPLEAFKTLLAKYVKPQTRKVQGVYAPQNVDAAPYVPPVDPGSGGGGGGGAGWKKHHEHKRRKDRELEDTIRQIYRELTQEPATVDIAVQIVAPITKPEAKAVPTVQQVEFEKATAEIETALRLVQAQIEDFKQAEEKDRQDLFEIIELMHMSGLI